MPSKIAADAILGSIARHICLYSFTLIKRSEQLSKRRDSAAKNAAATTMSMSKNDSSTRLKCVNAHATRVGKTKVVLMKTDQPYWWLRP